MAKCWYNQSSTGNYVIRVYGNSIPVTIYTHTALGGVTSQTAYINIDSPIVAVRLYRDNQGHTYARLMDFSAHDNYWELMIQSTTQFRVDTGGTLRCLFTAYDNPNNNIGWGVIDMILQPYTGADTGYEWEMVAV